VLHLDPARELGLDGALGRLKHPDVAAPGERLAVERDDDLDQPS
jgi:hypothetical protein